MGLLFFLLHSTLSPTFTFLLSFLEKRGQLIETCFKIKVNSIFLLESIDKCLLYYNILAKDESLSVKKYADAYLRKKLKEKREEMDEQIKSNNRRFL